MRLLPSETRTARSAPVRSTQGHPGEIFGSGTVGGGCGLERKHFLSPGDVVELEIEEIGVLRNRIVKEE